VCGVVFGSEYVLFGGFEGVVVFAEPVEVLEAGGAAFGVVVGVVAFEVVACVAALDGAF